MLWMLCNVIFPALDVLDAIKLDWTFYPIHKQSFENKAQGCLFNIHDTFIMHTVLQQNS